MMSTFVRSHLVIDFLFFLNLASRISGFSNASPTPPNECKVVPPMLQAAIPVDAVTAMASGLFTCFFFRPAMISRSRTDLPVPVGPLSLFTPSGSGREDHDTPALPVKKMLLPSPTTYCKTFCCSILSVTFCLMFIPDPPDIAELLRLAPCFEALEDAELNRFCFLVSLLSQLYPVSSPKAGNEQATHPIVSSHGNCLFLEGRSFGMDGKDGWVTTCISSSLSTSTSAFGLGLPLLGNGDLNVAVGTSLEDEAMVDAGVGMVDGVGTVLGLSAAMIALRRASFAASGSLVSLRFTL